MNRGFNYFPLCTKHFLFFVDECLRFLLFMLLAFMYHCLIEKHFVSVANCVIHGICYCCQQGAQTKLKRTKNKPRAWSDFFLHYHYFTLHLSLCLHLKHLPSLSDSVSFVGALRSCLNVMSRQTCLSSQSYFERARGEQDHRGKNLS